MTFEGGAHRVSAPGRRKP